MIKLFATDLDGTLIDRQGHIAEEDIIALRRARKLGVTVIVATGRMPTVIDHFLQRLETAEDEPVVGAQGAVIARRNGNILHTLTLSRDIAEEGADIARKHGAIPVFYTTHDVIMEQIAFSPEEDAYWLGSHLRYEPNALAHIDGDLVKLLAVNSDENAVPALLADFRQRFNDRADVVRSWRWFVEVVNKDANKGAAIAWIANQLHIKRGEVLAIGDAGNDVSMLKWAGHGVAPADAAPEARSAADWIAPPLPEHPVAATLQRYVFDITRTVRRDIFPTSTSSRISKSIIP